MLLEQIESRSSTISEDRKSKLDKLVKLSLEKYNALNKLHLNFICTHNSRRSQLGECLALILAKHFEIPNVQTFSGGTEATAFNPRMVKALESWGIAFEQSGESDNPRYYYSDYDHEFFSKVYNDPFNPQSEFIAITVCTDAEERCPIVFGAYGRIHLPFQDPKHADDTEREQEVYRDKVIEIGAELFYTFKAIKSQI